LARQVAHLPHDARESFILRVDAVYAAALAAKPEAQRSAADSNVVGLHRREPVRVVLLGIFFVADTDHRRFEQRNDGRENLLARQPGSREIADDRSPNSRQRLGEGQHPVELRLIANLAPARMVPVLLASARVAAGRLEMPVLIGRNPDVGIGRRDSELANSSHIAIVGQRFAVEPEVREAAAPLHRS
jgi:hypothetical protein